MLISDYMRSYRAIFREKLIDLVSIFLYNSQFSQEMQDKGSNIDKSATKLITFLPHTIEK